MKFNKNNLIAVLASILGAFAILIGIGFGIISSIDNDEKIRETPNEDESSIQKNENQINITFINRDGEEVKLIAEIADTPEDRTKGLMNRTLLDFNKGMLFIFEDESPRSFWMKDTYIPLDIIFLDSNKTIVKINSNATPLDTSLRYPSDSPAKYAIETNGNWSSINKIDEGSKVYF